MDYVTEGEELGKLLLGSGRVRGSGVTRQYLLFQETQRASMGRSCEAASSLPARAEAGTDEEKQTQNLREECRRTSTRAVVQTRRQIELCKRITKREG